MRTRYLPLKRKGRENYYCEDAFTGKQTSLHTNDYTDALRLINAKNEAERQPAINLQMAQVYWAASDAQIAKRAWQFVMDEAAKLKDGPTKDRWMRAMQDSHPIIEGDATNDAVLQQAGIQHARMVIAAREDDGENAFITLGAKDLNPNVRVMAVASSALSIRRLKLARADLVFSPAAVGSRLLADLVEGNEILPGFRDLLEGHPKKV